MTSGQKVAFSTLFSVAFFAAFVFVTKTDFIPEIEKRFYTQAKVQQKETELNDVAKGLDSYIQNIFSALQNDKTGYLNSAAISSYLSQNPAESETIERRNITEKLFYDYPALKGIRFIDKNGVNIHFSTYDRQDVLKHVGIKKFYKNYSDIAEEYNELDIKKIFTEKTIPSKSLFFDETKNRIVLVFPVNWLENVYAGCFLFYFDVKTFTDELLNDGYVKFSDNLQILSDENYNGGFVIGLPNEETQTFADAIKKSWAGSKKSTPIVSNKNIESIVTQKDGSSWVMMNSKNQKEYKVGFVIPNSYFELPTELVYLIYFVIFTSLFLVIFLLFSLKRDSVYVLKRKIRKIQYGIIKEYLDNQEKIEWKNVAHQLKARNEEITKEIRKSLGRKSKFKSSEIETILQKSWTEVIDVISSYSPDALSSVSQNASVNNSEGTVANSSNSSVTIEQIKQVMEELLKTTTLNVAASSVTQVVSQKKNQASKFVEPVEEIEDVEEIEELSDEVESLDEIDEVEELDDLEEVESLDEVEELCDELEEIEDVDEVEPAEAVDDVEELEDVEEIEELDDEVTELDEVEELDDVEELETLEEVLSVEEFMDEPSGPAPFDSGSIDDIAKNASAIQEVFVCTDEFATVDNLWCEELCIGSFEVNPENRPQTLKVFKPNFVVSKKQVVAEKVPTTKTNPNVNAQKKLSKDAPKKITEDVVETLEEYDSNTYSDVKFSNQFSMVSFGVNIGSVQELQQVKDENTIVEKEGIFSISDNLDYSKCKPNAKFKNLVDDVLKH